MKKLVLFLALFFVATMLPASPSLICDSTTEDVTHFVIEVDGIALPQLAVGDDGSGGKTIMFDLESYADGPHTFRAKWRNDLWDKESAWSSPFGIDPPQTLSVPQGLMLVK